MTDTSQADMPPQTNGVSDSLDEDERAKMRPVDIDADVREMERRKRVELIMNSKLFREELERIIETQLKDGGGPNGLLQQISDMVGVNKQAGNVFKSSNCVIPINDIRGIEAMGYAKGEKILRCKLACLYRLIDLYGWAHGSNTLITARLNQDEEQFLVNPYGMLFHEITASSLIKTDMKGNVLEQGTTNFPVNITAFSLHGAVHSTRPDIKCIIHIHTPSVVAVSALKQGLLPLTQESVVIGEVSTHTYLGGLLDPEEKDKLTRNLGPVNKILLLSNQGALCCGETIEEAFFNARNTVLASESQLKLLPVGLDNLVLINDEMRKKLYDAAHNAPQSSPRPDQPTILESKVERKWRVGGTEFESLMRLLDNAGFRTGYIYRHPLVKGDPPRPKNDVEVPPAVSSLGYLLEEEELYRQGLWRKLEGGKKGQDRSRWLNSPNTYQKVEILETGTPDPKKITKWVADGSPSHSSTPVKIDSALQFVPKGTHPREFKQKQQQIKDYRRADKLSAGPQSHILEGVTWEEARKMQDATITQTGDHVVLMGAASKGIIQRGHQHNAMVYKSPYAKNPFDCVTDEELDEYKKVVEKKTKGDYDTDYSESEGLSSAALSKRMDGVNIMSPTSVTSETEEESRDEPQILRIETKTAPKPSQPEVVLSDVQTSPVENFLRAERVSVTSQRSFTANYRTYSHAGLPKGSYLIPNPTHFHIACEKQIAISRPQITTISSSLPNQQPYKNKNPTVIINFDETHSVSLNIPLVTVRSVILPFAKALDFKSIPVLTNKGSQTSYMTPRKLNFNKVTYTPLFVDSYKTCHSKEESLEKSRMHEKRFLENLHREIQMTEFNSESSDSEMSNTLTNDENVNIDEDNDDDFVFGAGDHFYTLKESGIQDVNGNRLAIQEIAVTLSKIIKAYFDSLYCELEKLFSFSDDDFYETNKIKLMNDLICSYTKFSLNNFSSEEKNELKSTLLGYTLKQLESDPDRNFGKLFSVLEVLNNVLNSFFDIVQCSTAVRTSTTSTNVTYQSTPKNQNKLDNNKLINSFKKKMNSKSGAEAYWITLNKSSPSQTETSFSSIYDDTDNTFTQTSEDIFNNDQSPPVSGGDIFEDFDANSNCLSEDSDSSEEETCFNKTVTTVLQNSTNFIRSNFEKNQSYVQEKSVRFQLSGGDVDMEDKENKGVGENSGNWMGYENAKF